MLGNYALKSAVLPTSLVAIFEAAFQSCYGLLTAIIPTYAIYRSILTFLRTILTRYLCCFSLRTVTFIGPSAFRSKHPDLMDY